MTGCCVNRCNNRTEKGFRVFRLPSNKRNKVRREEWARLIGRDTLPEKAYVCEVHFDNDQFENERADGRKLLRPYAIPNLLQKHTAENAEQLDLPEATINFIKMENIESYEAVEMTACTIASNVEESQHCTNTARSATLKCKTYDEKYVSKLRKTIYKLKPQNEILKKELRRRDMRFEKIFNED